MKIFTINLAVLAIIGVSNGVSTKLDFGEEDDTIVETNSSKTDDEDVQVQHTVVVSTKLKNNIRRGIQTSSNGDSGTLSYNIGKHSKSDDTSSEVPVISGFKSVESTRIRTPDTRHKPQIYPDALFVTRNIRDQYDNVYPNFPANPVQWKPSTFFNNINYRSSDSGRDFYSEGKKNVVVQNSGKFHRKITHDGAKEFYCRKCMELSNVQGTRGCSTVQQRSANPWYTTTTTPKVKIDGKLMKLN